MADISKNLQDYLSRSSTNSEKLASSSSFNSRGFPESKSWFGQSKGTSNVDISEAGDSWFLLAQSDPLLPSMTKKQRIIGFIMCLLLGSFCFSLAGLYLPLLILKARKFALLYSFGSLFIIFSFSLLWGPVNHIKHLFSMSRLPFTTAYFGTMFATLYFSLWVKSTLFTVIFAIGQIIALLWYIVSYIPGGQLGLKFFSKIFYAAASKTAQKTLPV